MGSSTLAARVWSALLRSACLVGCGAGGVVAAQHRLWACVAVLALAGTWAGARAAWSARGSDWPAPPPPPPPDIETARSELRLARSLLDQTPAPLVIAGPDGDLRAGNRAARRLFGVDDRLSPAPPALLAALGQTDPGRRLTVSLDLGGEAHAYALSIADLTGPDGPMRLAALIDIQPEIRAAEAAALRELMQVLSHEIMNALTPVTSLAASAGELLSEETSPGAVEAADAVAILARRAEGLTRFVDAYRTLARLPEPVLAKVSLTALFEEAARMFHGRWAGRGVALIVNAPRPDVVLDLDLDLMTHALANILSNGAEAALEAGGPAPSVTLSARVEAGSARLIVEDTGPGVPPADTETIFRPFFTTKQTGSGVGLSFARQVALSHGGGLTLAPPKPGRGARFILAL